MKNFDLTQLRKNDEEYKKMTEAVLKLYQCEWNDEIHDSFLQYVNQVQEYSRRVHIVRSKAETLVKETEGLKIDEKKKRAESLCREADSI